jgi:uncharacterized damage-inducible protein DinB
MSNILSSELLRELEEEAPASLKCLERIPAELFDWKPHEKSMKMGSLAFIVADIPRWITNMIKAGEIDFGKDKHDEPKTTEDLIKFHNEHMKSARNYLQKMSDEDLQQQFQLKFNGQVLYTATKLINISSSIRHLAHHRGQLTVYMKLKNIKVPSIYGPSGDEQAF